MTQTVLITGGSGGIGFELAKCFAADGYRIVLVARRKDELEKAAIELRVLALSSSSRTPIHRGSDIKDPVHITQRHGSRLPAGEAGIQSGMTAKNKVMTIAIDLSGPSAPAQLISQLTKQKITIDVLVNNAGFGLLGAFSEADETKTLGMIQLNILALTELTKRLVPGMLKRKQGRILNIASTAAFQPGPFMAVYYATKAYVLSFSEALFEELRGTSVTVTILCPGPTATNFQARAHIESVPLFRAGVMDVAVVAKIGYTALQRGQRLVIPGVRNALGAFLIRFAPRSFVLHLVRSLQTP